MAWIVCLNIAVVLIVFEYGMKDTIPRPRPSRRDNRKPRPKTAEKRGVRPLERDIPKLFHHDEHMRDRDEMMMASARVDVVCRCK